MASRRSPPSFAHLHATQMTTYPPNNSFFAVIGLHPQAVQFIGFAIRPS
jgi:hypothetical protein